MNKLTYPSLVRRVFFTLVLISLSGATYADDTKTDQQRLFGILEATTHMMKQDHAAAIRAYDELLKQYPDDGEIISKRGYAILSSGDQNNGRKEIQRGINSLNKAISSNPDSNQLFYARGSAYRWLKQFDLAIKDIQQAMVIKPDRKNYQLDLQMIELEKKMQ